MDFRNCLITKTRNREAKRSDAGEKIPAVKMATNLEAVKTPTNIRSTFAVEDDKTENFGKRRLQDKLKKIIWDRVILLI